MELTLEVNLASLSLAEQVLAQQADHASRGSAFIKQNCTIRAFDFGLLLQVLHPINTAIVELGAWSYTQIGQIADCCANKMQETISEYEEADKQAHTAVALLSARLGVSAPAFSSGSASVQTSSVVEREDPTLVFTPSAPAADNFVEAMRWSCGLMLGAYDWLMEQLIGYSIIEEVIMKPFAGDWDALAGAQDAWSSVGKSLITMAGNFTGLPAQLDDWQGNAADRFALATTAIAATLTGLSYAADEVASVVGNVILVCKLACAGISRLLKLVSEKLLRIAIEMAIPFAGWVTAAIETAAIVWDIIGYVKLAFALIEAIASAISGVIESLAKLQDIGSMINDLITFLVGRAGQPA